MLKHFHSCVLRRIEFLQDLCLLKSFKEAITIDFHKHHQAHHKLSIREKLSIEFLLGGNGDEGVRAEFHMISLRIFRRWESRFRRRCFRKGKLTEIVETYLEFYESVKELKVTQYIAKACLIEPYEKTCVLHLLANTIFTVLRSKTQSLLVALKPHPLTLSNHLQDSPIMPSPIMPSPSSALRSRPPTDFIIRNHSVQRATPTKRKNTPPMRNIRRVSRTEIDSSSLGEYENELREIGELAVKGKAVTELTMLEQFKVYFRQEWNGVVKFLPQRVGFQEAEDGMGVLDDKVKGLWLRKNYQILFYSMLERNTQIKLTTLQYRKYYKNNYKSKRIRLEQ